MPSAGDSGWPSSVMGWVALNVEKQYHGLPLRHDRHEPHTARQLSTTKSPGSTDVTSGPTASTTPAASWPSRNGKVVVDRALAVVQVGVADAARLHVDQRFTRTRVGHLDRLDRDRLAFALGDDPTYLMRHESGAYRRRRGQAGGTSSGGSVT